MDSYDSYQIVNDKHFKQIPSGWHMRMGFACFEENRIKNVDLSQHIIVRFCYGRIVRKSRQTITLEDEPIVRKYTVVQPLDIIINGLNLNYDFVSQRVGIVKEEGVITSAYLCLRCRNEVYNPYYANYLFKSLDAKKIFHGIGSGIRLTLGYSDISRIKIPVPPIAEQDQIVRYLDWKTSEIHRLINGLQQQILLLKQRNTVIIDHAVTKGIRKNRRLRADKAEWMEGVPSEWLSCRMKNFFTETNVRSIDGHEPHLSMSQKKGLVTDDEDIERRLLSESYVGGKVCQKDDLVLNRLKAHLGVFALAPMEGVISPDYTVLHLNQDRIIPKYAEYLLKSNACRKELRTRVRGIVEGFWRLYTEDLGSIPVCLPDIDEQKEILDYVKDYEEKSNQMIGKLEKEIELLREYRTRLISDVVTGQMDVRNVEIPDYIPEQDEVADAVDETDIGEVDADAE